MIDLDYLNREVERCEENNVMFVITPTHARMILAEIESLRAELAISRAETDVAAAQGALDLAREGVGCEKSAKVVLDEAEASLKALKEKR